MVRFHQREVLWIVRGMRLGKFLRRCVGTVRRYFTLDHWQVETEVADEATGSDVRMTTRRLATADPSFFDEKTPAKQKPSSAGCGRRRVPESIPAPQLPRARARTNPSRLS